MYIFSRDMFFKRHFESTYILQCGVKIFGGKFKFYKFLAHHENFQVNIENKTEQAVQSHAAGQSYLY